MPFRSSKPSKKQKQKKIPQAIIFVIILLCGEWGLR